MRPSRSLWTPKMELSLLSSTVEHPPPIGQTGFSPSFRLRMRKAVSAKPIADRGKRSANGLTGLLDDQHAFHPHGAVVGDVAVVGVSARSARGVELHRRAGRDLLRDD